VFGYPILHKGLILIVPLTNKVVKSCQIDDQYNNNNNTHNMTDINEEGNYNGLYERNQRILQTSFRDGSRVVTVLRVWTLTSVNVRRKVLKSMPYVNT